VQPPLCKEESASESTLKRRNHPSMLSTAGLNRCYSARSGWHNLVGDDPRIWAFLKLPQRPNQRNEPCRRHAFGLASALCNFLPQIREPHSGTVLLNQFLLSVLARA